MKSLLAIINQPKNLKKYVLYAISLAQELKTDLHFLHIMVPENIPIGVNGATGMAAASALEYTHEQAKDTERKTMQYIKEYTDVIPIDISVNYHFDKGALPLVAEEYVQKEKSDIVLMEEATDGKSWIHTSATMEVLFQVNCPVWVAPADSLFVVPKRIVYATDFKEEDLKTLSQLVALTQTMKPEITALHFTNDASFEEKVKITGFSEMVQQKIDYTNITIKLLSDKEHHNMAQSLNDYAIDKQTNLIVMLKSNRGFFDRMFKPDPAKVIIEKVHLPVLVFHE